LIDKKLLFVIPTNHLGYEVKNVIIAETRPEVNRKPITESFRQEPVVVVRVSTGQEGGWGGNFPNTGPPVYVPVALERPLQDAGKGDRSPIPATEPERVMAQNVERSAPSDWLPEEDSNL